MLEPTCLCSYAQPLSWLVLERYQLGELAPDRRREVVAHLAGCPCCRRCLAEITGDQRVLPPLPLVVPSRRRWGAHFRPRMLVAAAATIAALALLALLYPFSSLPPRAGIPPSRLASFKGGELALSLVRDRHGGIRHHPRRFKAGDRFKALVTCPPGEKLSGQLVIFQGDAVYFPLHLAAPLGCGNRRPLSGAFQLNGDQPATVCLVVSERAAELEPARLRRASPPALPAQLTAVCLQLLPTR